MTENTNTDYSRRIFLRALGLGAAGLAVGGGAAWAQSQLAENAAAQTALATLQTQMAAAQAQSQSLDGLVAGLQTQVSTLDAQLVAANGQNIQLAEALTASQNDAKLLTEQVAALQAQLNGAQSKLQDYGGLIGLYEQLEAVGLDALTQDGLKATASGLAGALTVTPLVQTGVQTARTLLAEFEKLLPDFNAALIWLNERVITLKLGLFSLEKAAKTTLVDAATGVVTVFGGFIKFVLDYLPFNIGEQTRATFSAAQTVFTHSVELTANTDEKVFGKLSRYVGDGPQNWRKKLVTPLRDEALAPTEQLLSAVENARTAFSTSLEAPTQAALNQRATLREQIAAYRAQKQL
jgi:hypothetical protein